MAENKQHPIGELMSTTMQKIREMVDVNTIIGTPIKAENVTIIPISKVSFGFGSGGTDFEGKNQKPDSNNSFGGGSAAGVNISPIAFLIVKDDTVKLLPVATPAGNTADRVVEMIPELWDKVTCFVEKQKDKEEGVSF